MKARTAFAVAALMTLPLGTPASADFWTFDRQHTDVRFSWNHMGLSWQSGRFGAVDGRLEFTPTDPEAGQVEVTIKVSSVSTGVKELDDLLKSADYFNAAAHPVMTFRSSMVRRTGERTGEVDGDLTIAGITKPVTLAVSWNFTGEHPMAAVHPSYRGKWVSGFSARTRIMRSAWGVSRAMPLVPDEITIAIEAELIRAE